MLRSNSDNYAVVRSLSLVISWPTPWPLNRYLHCSNFSLWCFTALGQGLLSVSTYISLPKSVPNTGDKLAPLVALLHCLFGLTVFFRLFVYRYK